MNYNMHLNSKDMFNYKCITIFAIKFKVYYAYRSSFELINLPNAKINCNTEINI